MVWWMEHCGCGDDSDVLRTVEVELGGHIDTDDPVTEDEEATICIVVSGVCFIIRSKQTFFVNQVHGSTSNV